MRRPIWRVHAVPLLAWCVLSAVAPARAAAHSFDPALLALRERQPGVFDVVWRFPGAPALSEVALMPEFPDHCRRVDDPQSDPAGNAGASFWRIDCGAAGLGGGSIRVRGLADLRLDAIVRITSHDGAIVTGVVSGDAERFVVPVSEPAGRQTGLPMRTVLSAYTRLGIAHIWLGLDHLLFVFALLLLVRSRRVLLQTITAFTIAHSVALALAVLGVVTIPAAPVEALIALSIVLVALELTRSPSAPPTLTTRYPWAVAFAFGLVHGLGFATALAEIGLPPDQLPLALFAFNVGVEIGQLAFVLTMLLPLRLLARVTVRWPRTRLAPSYAIGTVAMAWAIERIAGFWTSFN